MTQIFLVRHGQTEWNRQNRLQGHKNSPLTTTGREQVLKTRAALSHVKIDRAYASPLQRALETLEIILEGTNLKRTIVESLKEINLGPWEGKTKAEIQQSHPREYDLFWNHQDRFFLKGAETYQQLQNRVVNQLNLILENEQGLNIIVVSHWIAIKSAVAYYTHTPVCELSNMPDLQNGRFLILQQDKDKISVQGL